MYNKGFFFAAKPAAVWAKTYNPDGSGYDDSGAAEAIVEMENGLSIQYSGSFVGSRYEYTLQLEGDKGTLRTDRSRVWFRPHGEGKFGVVKPSPVPEGEPLRYPHAGMVAMLAQFRSAIEKGTEPETSGHDNLWTLSMFEAAVRSSETGRYVSIDEVFTPEMQGRVEAASTRDT